MLILDGDADINSPINVRTIASLMGYEAASATRWRCRHAGVARGGTGEFLEAS